MYWVWCLLIVVVVVPAWQVFNATTGLVLSNSCYSQRLPPTGGLDQVFLDAVFASSSEPALASIPACSGEDKFMLQWGDAPGISAAYCQKSSSAHEVCSHLHHIVVAPAPCSAFLTMYSGLVGLWLC